MVLSPVMQALAQIPTPVQYVVFGDDFPAADTERMYRIGDAHLSAADTTQAERAKLDGVIDTLSSAHSGDSARALHYAKSVRTAMITDEKEQRQIGRQVNDSTADVEKTQIQMAIFGLMMAYQISAAMVASPAPGVGSAVLTAAARKTFLEMLAGLCTRLSAGGLTGAARRYGMLSLKFGGLLGGVDLGIQGLQVAQGHRSGIDTGSVLHSAALGATMAGAGALGREVAEAFLPKVLAPLLKRLSDKAVALLGRGAATTAEGISGVLGAAALTGELTLGGIVNA
ncbi:MAG: hypothetical protein HOU01_10985, partial [Streptomycetaceae bacterium]|nr:hypothetical protein [Streptomycetaceae bacterium]